MEKFDYGKLVKIVQIISAFGFGAGNDELSYDRLMTIDKFVYALLG